MKISNDINYGVIITGPEKSQKSNSMKHLVKDMNKITSIARNIIMKKL